MKEILTDPDEGYEATYQSLKAIGLTQQDAIAGAMQALEETAQGAAESNRYMAGRPILRVEGKDWVFTHAKGRVRKFVGKTLDEVAKSDLWFLSFLASVECRISKEEKKIIGRSLP